jgi:Haem-binding uptake, Tiki superfamily, ChaN
MSAALRDVFGGELQIYRQQGRHIAGWVGRGSKAFRRYQLRYRAAISKPAIQIAADLLASVCAKAECVLYGDYHSFTAAQQTFLDAVTFHAAQTRPLVVALEFFRKKDQRALDAFIAGRLSIEALAQKTHHLVTDGRGYWHSFAPLLTFARAHHIQLLGVDVERSARTTLQQRDAAAAEVIATAGRQRHRPLVLTLIGQFHLAPRHLPEALKRAGVSSPVSVYQNAEAPYFRSNPVQPAIQRLGDGAFNLVLDSPVECQHSFLQFIDTFNAQLEAASAPAALGIKDLMRQLTAHFLVDRSIQTQALSRCAALSDLQFRAQVAYGVAPPRGDTLTLARARLHEMAYVVGRLLAQVILDQRERKPNARAQSFLLHACGVFAERHFNRLATARRALDWPQRKAVLGETPALAKLLPRLSATAFQHTSEQWGLAHQNGKVPWSMLAFD